MSEEWRHWEPSREAVKAAKDAAEENTCNRHDDCQAANKAYRAKHGRDPGFGFHCHDEDCEDCFGC